MKTNIFMNIQSQENLHKRLAERHLYKIKLKKSFFQASFWLFHNFFHWSLTRQYARELYWPQQHFYQGV